MKRFTIAMLFLFGISVPDGFAGSKIELNPIQPDPELEGCTCLLHASQDKDDKETLVGISTAKGFAIIRDKQRQLKIPRVSVSKDFTREVYSGSSYRILLKYKKGELAGDSEDYPVTPDVVIEHGKLKLKQAMTGRCGC